NNVITSLCYNSTMIIHALVVEIPAVTSLIPSLSKALYALESNKPSASELIIDSQARVPVSQTCSQNNLCSLILLFLCLLCYFFLSLYLHSSFCHCPTSPFSLPLDNYKRNIGTTEDFTPQQLRARPSPRVFTVPNESLHTPCTVFAFCYRCTQPTLHFQSQRKMINVIKIKLYLSHRASWLDAPEEAQVPDPNLYVKFYLPFVHSLSKWTSYPDVLGMQFTWDGYFKQVGSAIIGCSSELAMYSLCYITRPGKQCKQSLGGKPLVIQTYTWEHSSYGNGKKYIGSAFPAMP
uniref:Uridylate-specific endoribonuclease n=1 Tax=Oncorhynchus kisutch TaxID=8019 RepID=A0A8C7F0R1_ONCKI